MKASRAGPPSKNRSAKRVERARGRTSVEKHARPPKRAKLTSSAKIEQVMMDLLEQRAGKTICPSEVARALAPDAYLPLMDAVRAVAVSLERRGVARITQSGKTVSLEHIRGPIRIGLV